MTAFATVRVAQAQQIPLDITHEGGMLSAYRLGISVGVNGLQPQEYLFDTGSDSFNIDVGTGHGAQAWFPGNTGQTSVADLTPYMYGDGTYGYLLDNTTVSSVEFYNSASGAKVADYSSSQGYAVSAATYQIATLSHLGVQQAGIQIDNPTLAGYGITSQPYYQNLSWQQAINNGQPPEEGHFYGTFGAGDFVYPGNNGGIPGQITTTGYVVEANGTTTTPGGCGQACMIMGLPPALRAQFFNLLPWQVASTQTFPVSGARASHEFDVLFNYTLGSGTKLASARLLTLLDSGTPRIQLVSSALLQQAQNAGLINQPATSGIVVTGNVATNLNSGSDLTVTGGGHGNQSYTITTDSGYIGDLTNAVTIASSNKGESRAVNGISFYFHNAVMYDLQDQITGYTPFFVTDANFVNGLTVTSDMGPLGVAGIVSGTNGVSIGQNADLFLTAANTYTGATTIERTGWLGIGGPGSIARSSDVTVDGTLDIHLSDDGQAIRSLDGSGQVVLGGNTLVLSNAFGTFSGSIQNVYNPGAAAGNTPYPVSVGATMNQQYGGLIIDSGHETLSGTNTYTGNTGIGDRASLLLTGALTGSTVVNAGYFENDGVTRAPVLSTGAVTGNGNFAGGLHIASGVVTPGNPQQVTPGTMTVGGNLTLDSSATYRFTTAGTQASLIAVTGTAAINGATLLGLATPQTVAPELGQHYTVLTATDGVTGHFDILSGTLTGSPDMFPFLTMSAAYAKDSVALDVSRSNVAFTQAAQTRNEYAIASALDGMNPEGTVARPITGLNFGHARAAFNALSGELYASARTALFQDAYDIRRAVTERMRVAECAPGAGSSGMKTASYSHGHRVADDGACQDDGPALWMRTYGEWSHNGGTTNARGLSNATGGFILGGDAPIAGDWRLGGLFTYGYSGFSTGHTLAGGGHSNNLSLGAYAGHQWGALGLRIGATYTWNLLSTRRTIAFPGYTGQANSRYDSGTAQAFADLGYRFTFRQLSVEPFGAFAHVNQQTNAFNETAAGPFALHARNQDTGVTFATFGMRLATPVPVGRNRIEPDLSLGYRHAFGTLIPTIRQSFTSGSSAFETAGVPLLKDAAIVNAGLRARLSDRTSINIGYTGQYGSRFTESGLQGALSIRF